MPVEAQEAFQVMLLEHLDSLADASAKAITNLKFDKVVVWENGGSNGEQTNVSNFLQGMSRTLPPMLQVMKDIGGVELPETFIRMAGEDPLASGSEAVPSSDKELESAVSANKPVPVSPNESKKKTEATKPKGTPKSDG